ncbi:MAG: DNA (cytosine-5-)-methyltransferase [Salinivirgaceae bacterium]|nr:DNA (cytosine-5-)-methyltransferase [Salinivirgaceae bacterium]
MAAKIDYSKVSIKLGTLFSGIGAIEHALSKLGVNHKIAFACDNGELELKLLDSETQAKYDVLKKIASYRLTKENKDQLNELNTLEQDSIAQTLEHITHLDSIEAKNEYVNQLYKDHSKGHNYVKDTYLANYKINERDFHLDVRFLDGTDYAGKVDLMVGGSPCQSFSSNGKRGGMIDTRGTLFHDYARIISEVRPKCFIFENVRGMLIHDKGNTWNVIKQTFRELDYNIYLNKDKDGNESPLLNACDYGVPQQRERIYLIGIRNDIQLKKPFEFPKPEQLEKTNKDYLDKEVPAKYYLGQKGFEFVTTHPTRAQVGRDIQKCQKANQQFNWNGDFIFEQLDPKKHNAEILQRAYVGEWNGQKGVIRMYTPRECLRLMGFDDSFKMPHNDNIMWRQSGNSIVVDVLMKIVQQLISTGIFE